MLAADKLLLQSSIRQNSIALKEKEFNLHHGNFNAVGTQAAVLAGFTVTAFIEFDCPPDTNRATKFAYYVSSIVSLAANILCVANTTFLSVWGTGLAMRGPDGSMARAVDGMYQLRRNVFALRPRHDGAPRHGHLRLVDPHERRGGRRVDLCGNQNFTARSC